MSSSAGDVPPSTEQAPGDDHLDFLLEWSESPEPQDSPATGASEEVAWLGASALAEAPDATGIPARFRPQSEELAHDTSMPEFTGVAGAEASVPGSVAEGLHSLPPGDVEMHATMGAEEGDAAQADGSPEFFEWTAERHRAIEEALGACPAGVLPRAHRQLEEIRRALESGEVAPERALALLDEVDDYLARRTSELAGRVPVAHTAVIDSRSDRERALDAYDQSVTALREYLATGDRVHLDLAAYTADQGSASLASARMAIMEAEPEPPTGVAEE